jgi:glycosyltransferase involved in cell wall biosynthesis
MQLVLDARMVSHSGIGRYIRYLIPLLLKRKDIHLTLLGNKKDLTDRYPRTTVVEMRSSVYSPFEQLEFVARVPPCDVLWSPHYNAPLFRTKAKTTVVTIHDLFPFSPYAGKAGMNFLKRSYARFLLKNAVNRSDRLIAVSGATLAEMKKLSGPTAKNTSVIHHYIDPAFRRSKTAGRLPKEISRKGGKYLLYVGNVKPHKNILGILGAFSRIGKEVPKLKLVIAGKKDGFITGMKNWDRLLDKLELRDRVIFTGILSDIELVALYNHAQALVFPSFYEGFGYPPLEAMACGCPSVVSRIPPLKETCGAAAVYVDPASVTGIADGIARVLDPSVRAKLARLGGANLKRFSAKSVFRKYDIFLDSLKRTEI